MSYNLGSARGDIHITYDNDGVARARDGLGRFVSASALAGRAMDENEKKSGKLDISLGKLGKAFLVMTKYVTITATAIQSLMTAINLTAGLIAAMAPIIGATLATLPALIFAAVGAALVLKAAFSGVGDALKAAVSGDAEKLAESLKKLAPSAQAFVIEIGKASKALKPMQQAIQQAFFSGLSTQVPLIVAGLKSLQGQAVGLATSFGGVATVFGEFLHSQQFLNASSQSLTALKKILDALIPGLLPLLNGFATLAGNAANAAQEIGGGLAPAMERAGSFLAGLDIKKLFVDGFNALKPLINLIADLGTILGVVFTALGGAKDVLGIIGEVVSKIAAFASSGAGVAAFTALGTAIQAIAGVAGQALLSLLDAIAPAIVAIAPLFTMLARVIGVLLTKAFEILGPIVETIMQALNGSLGPLLSIVGDAILKIFNAVGPLLSVLASNLQPLLAALSPVVGALATAFGDMLAAVIGQIIPILLELLPVMVDMAEQVGPSLVQLIGALAKGFVAAAPLMLVMVNILVGFLIPALMRAIPVIAFVISAFATLLGWLAAIIAPIASFIGKWTEALRISEVVNTVFNFVRGIVGDVVGAIIGFVSNAVGSMIGAFGRLAAIPGQIGGYFAQISNAISAQLSNALGVVRALPGQISGALGNLGNLLFGAGQAVIEGLVNGIRSLAGRAADAARQAVAGIPDAVKGFLGIGSPSKVTMKLGEFTTEGFVIGMLKGVKDVLAAARTAASAVTVGLPGDTGAAVSSAVSASVTASAGTSRVAATAAPVVAAGPVLNTTVNAPQNMNPTQVARMVAARLAMTLSTAGSVPASA